MSRLRSFVLPIAIILGLLLHRWCSYLAFIIPYAIFIILLLNFAAVDVRKLRINKLSIWIMLFQIFVSLGCYLLVKAICHNELVAQGLLVGILCPVACSVVVISCILGANRETLTEYTILGNLMVAAVAPFFFSFIGLHQDMPFWTSFLLILSKIGPTIAFPFFVALLLQMFFPKANAFLSKYKNYTFYIWAFLLLLVLGRTIDYVFLKGKGNEHNIFLLGVASIITCAVQFGFGKWLGSKQGDKMAGGQLLGQKNTAMGIWMATTYLDPLSSVFLAFYSVWQNIFNSWQIWRHDRRVMKEENA